MIGTRWQLDGGGEIALLATVPGIVAERERVRAAYRHVQPKAVAVGVSPESAADLLRYERDAEENPFEDLPDHDYVYSEVLRRFGEVDLPPPDLVEAARLAKGDDIPFHGLDLPEERYEDLFTTTVTTWQFLKMGRVQRRLAKRPPRAEDARTFVLAWDAQMRRVKGLDTLERAREEHVAAGALQLAAQMQGPVLVVVEVPREAGVRERLASAGAKRASWRE